MRVAEITRDRIAESKAEDQKGRPFEYKAMADWWGWNDIPAEISLEVLPQTPFILYDDDGDPYYEGWLKNDDQCIVQEFVLKWAEAMAGCTTIEVLKDGRYVQEIG